MWRYSSPPTNTISGPAAVCATNVQPFSVNNLPSGATVYWGDPSTNLIPVSGQNSNSYVVKANGSASGSGWIQATISSYCPKQYPVWVGSPESIGSISTSQYSPGPGSWTNINVPRNVQTPFYGQTFTGADLNFTPNTKPDSHGATIYNWSCSPSGYTMNPVPVNSRYTFISFNNLYYFTLTLRASNVCGSSQYQQNIYVTSGYSYSLSPNPATNNVTVTIVILLKLCRSQLHLKVNQAPLLHIQFG